MSGSRQETKYRMLARHLREGIQSGRLPYQQKLPTEEQLAAQFQVSRITVRQALTLLEQQSYIHKMQGKGSYVIWQQTQMQLNSLQGFSEEMRSKGLVPTTKLLDVGLTDADEAVAAQLQITPGQPVYRVVRLRVASSVPMCIEALHVSQQMCPDLDKQTLNRSIYDIFTKTYGYTLRYADQEMEAGQVCKEDAVHLEIAQGAPVLLTRRTTYLDDGRPLEYVHSTYRGDRYKITARLEIMRQTQ